MIGRLVAALLAGLLGAFVGTVATVMHQADVVVAGLPLPWGIVGAALAVVLVLLGLRWVVESRGIVTAGAIGVIVPVVVFALPGMGGSVIIPMNIVGIVWAVGIPITAVIIAMWPKPRSRTR